MSAVITAINVENKRITPDVTFRAVEGGGSWLGSHFQSNLVTDASLLTWFGCVKDPVYVYACATGVNAASASADFQPFVLDQRQPQPSLL